MQAESALTIDRKEKEIIDLKSKLAKLARF